MLAVGGENQIKRELKELLNHLKKDKGVTLVAISKATGISLQKLKNINTGRSSGDSLMLKKLKEVYSDLMPTESNRASDFASKEEEYKAEIERLKKKVEAKEERIMKLIDLMYGDKKENKP